MIDLHSHILPGVDDGSSSLDESVAMCRASAEDGITAMVATPHLRQAQYWNDDRELLVDRFRALRSAVRRELGDRLEVHLGGEIALHSESLREIEELPEGDLLTLAGTRYVLLELDWQGVGPDPVETCHELVVAGMVPIVAHPERVRWLVEDRGLQEALVECGALFQLTAMSVTGEIGTWAEDAAAWMLDHGLAHFVSSDTHDPSVRKPGLAQARQVLSQRWGDEVARALVEDHPRAVLEDRPIGELVRTSARERDGEEDRGTENADEPQGLLSGFARRLLSREDRS